MWFSERREPRMCTGRKKEPNLTGIRHGVPKKEFLKGRQVIINATERLCKQDEN